MTHKAVFAGLVFDENGQPVEVVYVGDDPCYVINDAGFRRHISAEYVDRQVFDAIHEMIAGHEGLISEQAAKMLGQEDIFSRALIESQLKNIDQQFENLLEMGIPEEGRAYMGLMGFRIKINIHGEIIEIEQPGGIEPGDEG